MAALNATLRPSFTPLRLVMPEPHADGSRRRLALRDAWRVQGNLETLGYFAADVCVGSPPSTFELIVDTGSSLMALPCAGCTHCGRHKKGARFDVHHSSTGTTIPCSGGPVRCSSCSSGQCGYSVSYQEGSRISGHMVEDRVRFASDAGVKDISVAFGCQTYESGLFNSQVADGIEYTCIRCIRCIRCTHACMHERPLQLAGGGWHCRFRLLLGTIRPDAARPACRRCQDAQHLLAMLLREGRRSGPRRQNTPLPQHELDPVLIALFLRGRRLGIQCERRTAPSHCAPLLLCSSCTPANMPACPTLACLAVLSVAGVAGMHACVCVLSLAPTADKPVGGLTSTPT